MQIQLYDTTLRDGTQGEGISLSCDDKLRIARRLDEFGMRYIEGGWPGSNPKDMEFFERARDELKLHQARVAAFGSTCKADTDPADDPQVQLLIDAATPVVTIFGKTWDLHVTEVLRTTLEENLRMIGATVRYLKSQGKEVIYDASPLWAAPTSTRPTSSNAYRRALTSVLPTFGITSRRGQNGGPPNSAPHR